MLCRFEVFSNRFDLFHSGGRWGGTGGTSAGPACWWVASVLVCVLVSRSACGQAAPEFNRDVRPILAENCLACHGVDIAARAADLRLDRREDAVDHGAIAPGDADASELITRILSDDPHLVMPPPETKKQLTADQQEVLRRWIDAGAEYQSHWSFIAPQRHALPVVQDESWIRNAIDRFTLQRLEAEGLAPAPEADPHTLFRRLHFDITGLPPQPDDLAAFVSDYQQRKDLALSEWIDRLMASPAWGEHRGRYWLDAARYADTHGVHFDNYREIWPYRDWVIRAFNANQPFDEFTVEQLAGDLLPDPADDQLIATGFQRCNITTNEGGTIAEENLANYAADRVQTFGWVFLGLTTNCAQCHDHKFDPITARDYYSLAAYFRNTNTPALDGNTKDGSGPVLMIPSEQDRPRWDALPAAIAAAKAEQDQRRVAARPAFESWLATVNGDELDQALSSDGLMVHLPLDEGAGQEVRNRANPAESFLASGTVDWIPGGRLGAAPRIEPSSTFDLGQHGDYEKDQPFSFGVWINPSNLDGMSSVVARMDVQARHRGWDLLLDKGSLAVHLIDSWNDNALKVGTDDGVVQANRWQHVLVVYDGSGKPGGLKIFVDGRSKSLKVLVSKLRPDASIRTTTPLRIGQRSEGAVFAGGAVQDFRLYDRTLAPREAEAITFSGQMRALLKTPPAERDPADLTAAFDNYLALQDSGFQTLAKQVDKLLAEQAAIRKRSPITHIQQEREDSQPMAHILMRGEYDQPGEQVAANTPEALHALPKDAPNNRLGLAMWVVDPANPLTTRVTVNRFWQEVFGQGLVTTAEDFGISGALAKPPGTPRLAGGRLPRARLGRQAAIQADADERHLPSIGPDHPGETGSRPSEHPAVTRATFPPRCRDGARLRAGGQRAALPSYVRARGQALSARRDLEHRRAARRRHA